MRKEPWLDSDEVVAEFGGTRAYWQEQCRIWGVRNYGDEETDLFRRRDVVKLIDKINQEHDKIRMTERELVEKRAREIARAGLETIVREIRAATVPKGVRLMTYKEIVSEYGASIWFWRTKKWQGKLKNCGFGNKHMFDRQDVERVIQGLKQQA